MTFSNEQDAKHLLANISYYRLKGYWWDMQDDLIQHIFKTGTTFETVIDHYTFDRRLRLILFDAIERIEIALRTKMIYHLSQAFGGLWYLDPAIFSDLQAHNDLTLKLKEEYDRSNEIFIKDHKSRLSGFEPDAWKIFEIASMGVLSKIYKNLKPQLREKALIANEMGLNLHSELSSWLESIVYVRNIIVHHSRLWNRTMVKKPSDILNPKGDWLNYPILPVQKKKPFFIISTMVYMCNHVSPNHQIKGRLLTLLDSGNIIPIYKMGFLNNWQKQELWK